MEPGYSVEERLMRVEVEMRQNTNATGQLDAKIDRLDAKLDGRPAWSVVVYLALLQTALGALATALIVGR